MIGSTTAASAKAVGVTLPTVPTHSAPTTVPEPPPESARQRIRVLAYPTGGADDAMEGARFAPPQPSPLTDAQLAGDAIALRARDNASAVEGLLQSRFGRNGWDGKGSDLTVAVHMPERNNAVWVTNSQRVDFGDGDGKLFDPLGNSLGVAAHEIYHGVIDSEVKLDYSKPQQAAIHESLADVFALGVTGGSGKSGWEIGADVFTPAKSGDAIRDLATPQVGHMKDARSARGESHALSGIPSLAAVRAAESIGRDDMQRVWYHALADHLPSNAGFIRLARATVQSASDLFGASSSQVTAVRQAWESVGVRS